MDRKPDPSRHLVQCYSVIAQQRRKLPQSLGGNSGITVPRLYQTSSSSPDMRCGWRLRAGILDTALLFDVWRFPRKGDRSGPWAFG